MIKYLLARKTFLENLEHMNNKELWQSVLNEFEIRLSKANFTTWFKNTAIKTFDSGSVVICVPSNFAKAWLEKKYHHDILGSLEKVTSEPIQKIEYRVESIKITEEIEAEAIQQKNQSETQESQKAVLKKPAFSSNLNPKYTFSTFITGKGTELAVAAAKAVADRPGEAYNPLFIYGHVGLGKTHLLQAVGHEILKRFTETRVLYTTIEKFKNDLVDSVRTGDPSRIKEKYRSVDVLLIDDIQFISGKEGTQEEMFHTFNELHQQNKQIVFSSDRPPKAIPALEERLRTRFEWGMIVDVAPPDLETRSAIVQKKAEEKGIHFSPEVIHVIVTAIQSNIRELEGAVNKITAYHQLKNLEPVVETVKSLLANIESSSAKKSVTPKALIKSVSEYYDVSVQDILGQNREKKMAFPRQMTMFLLREDLKMSFPSIGEEVGGKDHTTAMHAHFKIKTSIENDLRVKTDVDLIRQRLFANSE